MNEYNVRINESVYSASHELQTAMNRLGFNYAKIKVPRGSHTGEIWLFDEDLDLAYKLGDGEDFNRFVIISKYRKFYISPDNSPGYINESSGRTSHWLFSIKSL